MELYVLVGSPRIFGIFAQKKLAEEHLQKAEKLSSHVHILKISLDKYDENWVV